MKKYLLFTMLLCLLISFNSYTQIPPEYIYSPSAGEETVFHKDVKSYSVSINPGSYSYDGWSTKIEVTNATLTPGSKNPQPGLYGQWWIDFSTANTQATVKISCIHNNVTTTWKIWTINVEPALAISGPDEIKECNTATYTSNLMLSSYQWSSTNLNIISGSGTKTITVSPTVASGTGQVKLTAPGGLTVTKNVAIKSCTTNINKNITANENFENRYINVYNTNITNYAVVNITGDQWVKITPNFLAQQGTKVIIKATGLLRSSSSISDDEEEEEFSEMASEESITGSINDVMEIPKTTFIRIYSLTGLPVYSSITDFDIKSANLSQGIYIIGLGV